MKTENVQKKIYMWTWDPVLVCYHNVVAQCYKNIEAIQTSIWGKIFKSLAQRKLECEYNCMNWANDKIEERVQELESTYNEIKVCRFNSINGEWLS
jgi:hypothetical protein